MIKNIKDLNEIEYKNLRDAYTKYFKNYASLPFPGLLNKLKQCSIRFNSESYVNIMLEAILEGKRIGFVSISDNQIDGFITGRVYPEETGWISHFYLKPDCRGFARKLTILELYQALATEMQKSGIKTVGTEASSYEAEFTDILETLEFEVAEEYKDEAVLYEKRLNFKWNNSSKQA